MEKAIDNTPENAPEKTPQSAQKGAQQGAAGRSAEAGGRARQYGRILRLGAPIIISQLGMIVVGFADNAMVGHYSTEALAAASFVNNLFMLAILMCIGFTYGLTPLVGALFARKADDDIGATLRRATLLNVGFSLLVTAVMTVVYFNLHRMGQPEHLLPLVRPYFRLYLYGVTAVALFQTFAQWAYAVNSTKMPMWIILAANAVNVAGNYLLIYGHAGLPELGLYGAGVATLVSRWICPAAIIGIFLVHRRYKRYHRGWLGRVKGRGERWGRIVATSLPVSLQMGLETAAFSLSAVMAGWLGVLELAAFQIILIVGTLGFCLYYGVATAISVLVANAKGADDVAGMRRVALSGYHIVLAFAVAMSVVFWTCAHVLIGLFTEDAAVEAVTLTLILPLVVYQLGDATQITFANALRGTSRVMPMVWIAFVSYLVLGLPATYLMAFPLGMRIQGIVYSFSVSLFCAGGLFLLMFRRELRRLRRRSRRRGCELSPEPSPARG